jgi:hypothetical protein
MLMALITHTFRQNFVRRPVFSIGVEELLRVTIPIHEYHGFWLNG